MIYYCIDRIISFDQPPSTPFLKNTNRDHQKSLEINMKAIYRCRLIYHSCIEMYILYSLSHFNSLYNTSKPPANYLSCVQRQCN